MDRFQVTSRLTEFWIDAGKSATVTNIGSATVYGSPDAPPTSTATAAWSLAPGASRTEDVGAVWVQTAAGTSSTLTVEPIASGLATDTGTGQPSAIGSPSGGSSGVILPWVTATAYKAGQPVTNGGRTYLAVDDHTSGATFAGDLASHWVLEPAGAGTLARTVAGGSMGATPSLAMLSTDAEVAYTGTLTANATLTVTNLSAGQAIRFLLTQDATGSRTFSITVGASTVAVPVNAQPATYTVVTATYDGTDLYVKGA